ncbi:MAG: TraB/GumN family protein, partial [Thermoanaerobaculales bacterium]|nr:TraB/GumN family protein [Thermoanaerobaculales bacterium]
EEEAAFLRYSLRDLRTIIPQLKELTDAWKSGDVEVIGNLLTDAFADEDELFGRLVTERNEAWLPRVEELLAGDQRALVVVGALHLVGSGGLVTLLQEAGYEVEQL